VRPLNCRAVIRSLNLGSLGAFGCRNLISHMRILRHRHSCRTGGFYFTDDCVENGVGTRDHTSRVYLANLLLFRAKVLPVGVGHNLIKVAEFAGAAQPLATIHHDGLSIEVGAAVADQECREIREFLRRAKAL
jgi:hypothetical protein